MVHHCVSGVGWIRDWKTLVNRYAGYRDGSGNPIVIGADVRNEPHLSIYGALTGSCWTGDASVSDCPSTNTAHTGRPRPSESGTRFFLPTLICWSLSKESIATAAIAVGGEQSGRSGEPSGELERFRPARLFAA